MGERDIDWSPTVAQKIGAVVGLLIGSATLLRDDLPVWVQVVFPVVYAVACAVIPRFRGVVRHHRTVQFSAHQVAMAAIALGWLVNGSTASAAINGAWFLGATLWWAAARRRD